MKILQFMFSLPAVKAMWRAVILLAVAGTAFADPQLVFPDPQFAFPEDVIPSGPRIVSGWEADIGQFPYQLGLRMVSPAGAVFGCGASILSAEWGLTAAHCTANRVTIIIRVGTVNMTLPTEIFETTKYFNHPLYNEAMAGVVQPHDIGVIEFGRTLTFGDLIQPIRIQRSSTMNFNYDRRQAIASGWGNTWTGGPSPENLNWVYLRITSNEECRIAYGGSAIIVDSTICTRGYTFVTQSTCQGDSGGPLTIIDDDGAITQVGVTSFVSGLGCHAGVPSGFIRPGHYHDWFTQVTGINFDWEYEVDPETTPGPQPETTPGPQPVTTPGPQPETTPTSQTGTTPGPQPETTPTSQTGTTPGPQPETTPTSQTGTTPGPQPETTPGPQPETTPGPQPETTPTSQTGTTPGPQPETTPFTPGTPSPEPETTPGPQPETTPGPQPETTPGPQPETTPGTTGTPGPQPETTPGPQPETTPGTSGTPGPQPETTPGPQPETTPLL